MGPIHFVGVSKEYYGFFNEYGNIPVINQYNWLENDLKVIVFFCCKKLCPNFDFKSYTMVCFVILCVKEDNAKAETRKKARKEKKT